MTLFKIRDLKRKKTNTVELIAEVKEKRIVPNAKMSFAKALLFDETGQIWLNLWGDQINQVDGGDVVHLKLAFTEKYKGMFVLNTWEQTINKEVRSKICSK